MAISKFGQTFMTPRSVLGYGNAGNGGLVSLIHSSVTKHHVSVHSGCRSEIYCIWKKSQIDAILLWILKIKMNDISHYLNWWQQFSPRHGRYFEDSYGFFYLMIRLTVNWIYNPLPSFCFLFRLPCKDLLASPSWNGQRFWAWVCNPRPTPSKKSWIMLTQVIKQAFLGNSANIQII